MAFRRVSLRHLEGDDATWAGLTLALLSEQLDLLKRDPEWAPKLRRVANAMMSGKTVRVEPQPLISPLLYPGEKVSEEDAMAAMLALQFLSIHFRDHEPPWSDQLRRVARAMCPGAVLRMRPPRRAFSVSNADDLDRATRLKAFVNRSNIIGGTMMA